MTRTSSDCWKKGRLPAGKASAFTPPAGAAATVAEANGDIRVVITDDPWRAIKLCITAGQPAIAVLGMTEAEVAETLLDRRIVVLTRTDPE
jgi:hypothetical protein